MHKIYFGSSCITICKHDGAFSGNPGSEVLCFEDRESVLNALKTFKAQDGSRSFILMCDEMEEAYRFVCSAFKEVDAAGGLVTDGEGKCLLIRRNDVWDLPKGHHEEGEDIVTTAVREVKEETGADGLTPESLLCITDHCYYRDGTCHLKHTWWYLMSCSRPLNPVPQTEEGITEAILVGKDVLGGFLEKTYPSILEVFAAAAGKW